MTEVKRRIYVFDTDGLHWEIRNSGITCVSATTITWKLSLFFSSNGYTVVDNWLEADDVILNTCWVASYCEKIYYKNILEIKNAWKRIWLCWCLAWVSHKLSSLVDFCLPNKQEEKVHNYYLYDIPIDQVSTYELSRKVAQHYDRPQNTYYLQVNRWCIHNCSYCWIKKSIWFTKSKPLQKIEEELQVAISHGYDKIHIITDDIWSYGHDIWSNMVELLNVICNSWREFTLTIDYCEPSEWIRCFQSMRDKIPYIKEVLIPVQSMNDRILKLMRRKYTVSEYLDILSETKKYNPSITIWNNIIYCYPTETFDEFKNNLTVLPLVDHTCFSIFSYIRGTKKFKQEDFLCQEEIRKRVYYIKRLELLYPNFFYWIK